MTQLPLEVYRIDMKYIRNLQKWEKRISHYKIDLFSREPYLTNKSRQEVSDCHD